jgi:ribosomal protein S18 acetylase RimI-like enzyme
MDHREYPPESPVTRLGHIYAQDIADLNALYAVLSPGGVGTSWNQLVTAMHDGMVQLVVRQSDSIVATASLVIVRSSRHVLGSIEDVVVLPSYQGHRFGEALVRQAVTEARLAGVDRLTLTSNPHRQAANALYQRLGFDRRDTNAWIYPTDRLRNPEVS